MMERPAVIEIEKRGGEYRIELRDQGTGAPIDSWLVEGVTGSTAPYKHVCKLRLPVDEPVIDLEADDNGRITLRADGRTCYRHELPTAIAAN